MIFSVRISGGGGCLPRDLWDGGPLLARSATGHGLTSDTIGRLRLSCVVMGIASILIAITLGIWSGVRIEPDGIPPLAWLLAALLVASSMWSRKDGHHRVADFFGTLGLVWLAGISCGCIAMLGLRLQRPLGDGLFLSADRALGIDAVAIVAWLVELGQWIFSLMALAYGFTIPAMMLSMAALALMGKRLEAWRAAFTFVGSLLTIVVIAMLMPAKGMGLWTPPKLLARLPDNAMRYFWPNFDAFYAGPDPVLRLDGIDGVVSFPSFHAVMGFITVAMWRHGRIAFPLALAWLAFMLLATFPYGGHYVVDILGGLAVWAAWFGLSRRLEARSVAR